MKATPENEALLTKAIGAVNRNILGVKKREEKHKKCVESMNYFQQVKASVKKDLFDLCSINQSLDMPEEHDLINKELALKTGLNYSAIDLFLNPAQLEVRLGLSSGDLRDPVLEMLQQVADFYEWEEVIKEAIEYRGNIKKITKEDVFHIVRKKRSLEE